MNPNKSLDFGVKRTEDGIRKSGTSNAAGVIHLVWFARQGKKREREPIHIYIGNN